MGFHADKSYLQIMETKERHGRVSVTVSKCASDNLVQVLSFVEQLIISVDHIRAELPPLAMASLTLSSDSEEETRARVARLEEETRATVARLEEETRATSARLEEEARVTAARLEARLEELRKEVKEISKSIAAFTARVAPLDRRFD